MKRMRELEDESARLTKVVADLSLDRALLQDLIKRKL
jgi:putative transposase